jgi:hypothetical protein
VTADERRDVIERFRRVRARHAAAKPALAAAD